MKIKANRKDLLQALARCVSVADSRSAMPILGTVLIERVDDGTMRLSATDLHMGVTHDVAADVSGDESIALPAKDLLERVKHLPEGEVTIETDEESRATATVRGSRRRYIMHGVDGAEFPVVPTPEKGSVQRRVHVDTLARLIGATMFSVSTDESRLHLNSGQLEWVGGAIVRMVSTDGHRLSKVDLPDPQESPEGTMLLPLSAIKELRRMCDESDSGDGFTHITIVRDGGASVFFDCGYYTLSCKTVDATFPPWRQVVPESVEQTVRVAREPLLDSIRAVRVAAPGHTGGIRLDVCHGKPGSFLKVSAESAETGEAVDELEIEHDGPAALVGLNAQYLIDVLGAMQTEYVALGMSGELDPITVGQIDPVDGEDYLAVVMPMRV